MFRTTMKMRLLNDGRVEIVDPDIQSLRLIKAINPEYRIMRSRLRGFVRPRLLSTRNCHLPLSKKDLRKIGSKELWALHDNPIADEKGEASLLDAKIELALRAIKDCRLCGRNCGIDRTAGKKGYCGLGVGGIVGECFVHIGEEPPINPSMNINLRGCGLQCTFCQKHELVDPDGPGILLETDFWTQLKSRSARSFSFIGGNPDESVYSILRFLAAAPPGLSKPIVWNSNGYAEAIVYQLLKGVVDAYIPDMKFYSRGCSEDLARCTNYFEVFQKGVEEMVQQEVPVIVRMLVMPGHLECCHIPLIRYLSQFNGRTSLHIMDQYYPDYRILQEKTEMNRRPMEFETRYARSYAERIGGPGWLLSVDNGST